MADDDQQDVHQEGVPQPVGNVIMQGEMQYLRYVDAPNYNVALYHPPPPPVSDIHRCDLSLPSDCDTPHSTRRFHTCTCIGM